ncbi:MAG: UPF0175 family protein [Bacteroidetes bacterium]|nr:UPF0175 family protein [Bacteroidota bacterium]
MRTLNLNIPRTVDIEDREVLMILASGLYERGKLSMGQAAELAGISKRTFIEILGHYGVSLFNQSQNDIDQDIKNAKNYCI